MSVSTFKDLYTVGNGVYSPAALEIYDMEIDFTNMNNG